MYPLCSLRIYDEASHMASLTRTEYRELPFAATALNNVRNGYAAALPLEHPSSSSLLVSPFPAPLVI